MSAKYPTKCTTGPQTRLSYLNVNQPRAYGDQKPKYSASLIIKKSDTLTLSRIDAAMRAAYEEGLSTLKGKSKVAPTFEEVTEDGPLHDGDLKADHDSNYAGCFYINAKNERKPRVIDENKNDILDPSELYSGIYGRVAIGFYAYNKNGNRGIGCSLEIIMKTADGEPLGSTISIEDAFSDDDDDFLS